MDATTATPDPRAVLAAQTRPITVDEYHRMGEAGILGEDDRVELLDGHLIAMSPVGPAHLLCVNNLTDVLAKRLYAKGRGNGRLSVQNPVRFGESSEPEPDLAILSAASPRNRVPEPADVLLVIEVADSSLAYDRTVKQEAYAQAGIPVYWIVNLRDDDVDVMTDPRHGSYAERRRYHRGDVVPLPETVPGDPVDVDAILGEAP